MKIISLLTICFLFFSCQHQVIHSKWLGKKAYTKHGFFHEKNRHQSANYIRGVYVPAGSEVKVEVVTTQSASLLIDGIRIELVNQEKFTNLNMEGVLDRLLSENATKLNISEKFSLNAKTGQPVIGMTKDEVLTVIGYPPAHKTFSLKNAEWVYWWSRFDTKKLVFEGEILKLIQN